MFNKARFPTGWALLCLSLPCAAWAQTNARLLDTKKLALLDVDPQKQARDESNPPLLVSPEDAKLIVSPSGLAFENDRRPLENGAYLFTLSKEMNLYAHAAESLSRRNLVRRSRNAPRVHHNSFLGLLERVPSAGMFWIQGARRLTYVNLCSGHYLPEALHLLQGLSAFVDAGFDLSQTVIDLECEEDRDPERPLRMDPLRVKPALEALSRIRALSTQDIVKDSEILNSAVILGPSISLQEFMRAASDASLSDAQRLQYLLWGIEELDGDMGRFIHLYAQSVSELMLLKGVLYWIKKLPDERMREAWSGALAERLLSDSSPATRRILKLLGSADYKEEALGFMRALPQAQRERLNERIWKSSASWFKRAFMKCSQALLQEARVSSSAAP